MLRCTGYSGPAVQRQRSRNSVDRIGANITLFDGVSKLAMDMGEWFLVPLCVIDNVVEKIKEGMVPDYIYDPQQARLERRSKQQLVRSNTKMPNLDNLSPIDFEELCRDLAKAETGKRFSAFGPGPDGGIDGRHSKGQDSAVLQCKHYAGSRFSDLKSSLKREVKKLSKLKPKRYLLFTSQSLTPAKSDALAAIFGEHLVAPEDIWGREDIEAALKRHPEVEKAHIKLWLSSAAVLERILQSGLEAFTQATKEEIREELRVYVDNPSFSEATRKLEKEKILIISGPPGVGKTTLAKMIAYSYLSQDWRFYAITSLDEGFSKIDDETPTVFFFDDFLGRIELDRQSLLQRDTALVTFVRRVRKSKNARFILTTRAHIFEEARRISDHVDDRRLQLSKYLLDVGAYTRKSDRTFSSTTLRFQS